MADTVLNILVKVAGQKEFNELVQKQKEGNITHGEQIRLRKLAQQIWLKSKSNLKEETVESRNLVAAKELVAASSQKVLTANGKMMQSYFRLGTQIRGTIMPMLSSGLPAGFSAVIGGVDMLVNNFERMRTKGVSAATALKNAFSGGLGIAAGLGLVVAAFAAIVKHANDTKDALENIKKLNDEILKLEVELGKKSREILINKKLENIALLKSKQLKLEAEEVTPSLMDILIAGSYMQAVGMARIRQTEEIAKLEKEILELETDVANENKKITDEKATQLKAQEDFNRLVMEGNRPLGLPSYMKPKEGITPPLEPLGHRKRFEPGQPISVDAAVAAQEKVKDEAVGTVNLVADGVNMLSGLIGNNLSQAWQRSFGEANSVAEQFFMRMAQMLADLAAQFALTFALNAISPGLGTLATGLLPSDSRAGSGSSVSSTTMDLARSTRGAGGGSSPGGMQLKTKISGSDLWIIVEKGKRQTSTRLVQ